MVAPDKLIGGMQTAMVIETDPPIPDWPGLAGRKIALAREQDIVTPPLRQVFAWWQDRVKTRQPCFEDVDLVDFGRIAPHLYVAAAIEAGYELRLAGEEYIRLFGLKKGWVWRRDSDDPVQHDSVALLDYVSQIKRPLRTIGRLELSERYWIELEALICPLAPGPGGAPKILGCVASLELAGRNMDG
jgi:hypothetical protein